MAGQPGRVLPRRAAATGNRADRAQAARTPWDRDALPSRLPRPPLARERDAVALSDFVADDHEIELALVEKGRDIGTDTELDLQPDPGVAGRELPKQGGERVQVEIFCRADADETAAVAAETMLGFLIQGKDAPRVRAGKVPG